MKKQYESGELEETILALFLQKQSSLSVKEIQKILGEKQAYTTILTILQRLYQKNQLNRKKEKNRHLYFLKETKEKMQLSLLEKIKKKVKGVSFPELFSYFIKEEEIQEEEILELEKMIAQYKKEKK